MTRKELAFFMIKEFIIFTHNIKPPTINNLIILKINFNGIIIKNYYLLITKNMAKKIFFNIYIH